MNISWRDLANVQRPGDYPFRDGTISVTFAEIAIWNHQPDAQFQLMRKYPLQDQARYALGKQLEHSPVDEANDVLIYTSSNGDAWFLTRDPTSGLRAVRHQPNRQSGGQVSCIKLDEFLHENARGPEHQALRRLLENQARVVTILIAYDIHRPNGEAHDQLIASIKTLGTWWHHLETIWIVKCSHTPSEIVSRLRQRISDDDQLLVIDVSDDTAGWSGVNDAGDKWLKDTLQATP
jgi:hypothetical protein